MHFYFQIVFFLFSLNVPNDGPDIFFKRMKETDSVRFLGIWLDTKLNFNDYFKKIYKRFTFLLYAMKIIKNFLMC